MTSGPAPASTPKVTVLITTFNHARYVRQAVESALAQETPFPVEVVVADDESTDGTREILDELRARGAPIRVIRSGTNRGDGGMRFFAGVLDSSRGEYVALLDGDDFWTATDKLRVQANLLDERPNCPLCFHDVVEVDETGTKEQGRVNPGPGVTRLGVEDLLVSCNIASCSPLLRKSVVAPLPDWYFDMPWGDWPIYIHAALRGPLLYQDRVMGVWRIHSGGMWSGSDSVSRNLNLISFYRRLRPVLPGFRRELAQREVQCLIDLSAEHAARGEISAARRSALEALAKKPFGRDPIRALLAAWRPVAHERDARRA